MRNFIRKWNKELNDNLPSLCGQAVEDKKNVEDRKKNSLGSFKIFIKRHTKIAVTASICTIVLIVACLVPTFLSDNGQVVQKSPSLILVEVNPKVVFCVDSDKKVTNVVGVNADSDVILSNKDRLGEMIGADLSQAVTKFVDTTVRLGYIDLYSQSAIRITSCEEEGDTKNIEAVKGNLEEYFRGKGAYVAVVAETSDMQTFCKRSGIDGQKSIEELEKSIENRNPMFSSGNKTWKESFALTVDKRQFLRDIYQKIAKKQAELDERLCLLGEISDMLKEIEDISQSDYWTLLGNESYGELLKLIEEMGKRLNKYEEKYSISIKSDGDVAEQLQTVNEIVEASESLSFSDHNESEEFISENLLAISTILEIDSKELQSKLDLYTTPETYENFLDKINAYYNDRLHENANSYEEHREVISEVDYKGYLKGLTSKYGSLSEFWEELEKQNTEIDISEIARIEKIFAVDAIKTDLRLFNDMKNKYRI